MSRLKGYGLPAALVALAVGIMVNFILLIPALGKLSRQATAGQLARERQCRILPVSDKLFKGAAHYGIITRADLRVYESVTPHCG